MQEASLLAASTARNIKRRVNEHEKATLETVATIQNHLDHWWQLERHRAVLAEQAAHFRERRTVWQSLIDRFRGKGLHKDRQEGTFRAEEAVVQEMRDLQAFLKDHGYRAVDRCTQAHYDDIRALAFLSIAGGTEAEGLHLRSTTSITLLRATQKELEALPLV